MAAVTLRESALAFRSREAQALRSCHDEVYVLLAKVRHCMDRHESGQIKAVIDDKDYEGLVEYIAWDLLPIIGPHLSDRETDHAVYNDCVDVLCRLSELGNPKEMFIGLLEQMDQFQDNLVHADFLRPLQTVIRRLGLTKPLYHAQLLSTLYAHVEVLRLPGVNGLGALERRLLSQDPDFARVEAATLALLEFLAPLVHDVAEALAGDTPGQGHTQKDIFDIGCTRTAIMKFILSLMEHPLIAIEFKYVSDPEEEEAELEELRAMDDETRQRIARRNDEPFVSRTSARQCMFFLDAMACDLAHMLFYADLHPVNLDTADEQRKRKMRREQEVEEEADGEREEKEEEEEDRLPVLGLSCFAYMIVVEGYETHRIPAIYSASHMMQTMMPYVEAMLRRTEEPIIAKGVEMLTVLVSRLDERSLHSSLLDSRLGFLKVPQCLVQIMVYCPSKPMRRMACTLLPKYMDSLDWKGRHHLLRTLLVSTEHYGVQGLLIGKVKDYVHCSLQEHTRNCWFLRGHLHHFYFSIFKLDPNDPDILDKSDKEIAALNFLRYLLLRDLPEVNATGIWSHLDFLQSNYLSTLGTGLEVSKGCFMAERKSAEEKAKRAIQSKKDLTGKIRISGHQHNTLSENFKIFQSALSTFELMTSILGRVGEIISAAQKAGSASKKAPSVREAGCEDTVATDP